MIELQLALNIHRMTGVWWICWHETCHYPERRVQCCKTKFNFYNWQNQMNCISSGCREYGVRSLLIWILLLFPCTHKNSCFYMHMMMKAFQNMQCLMRSLKWYSPRKGFMTWFYWLNKMAQDEKWPRYQAVCKTVIPKKDGIRDGPGWTTLIRGLIWPGQPLDLHY